MVIQCKKSNPRLHPSLFCCGSRSGKSRRPSLMPSFPVEGLHQGLPPVSPSSVCKLSSFSLPFFLSIPRDHDLSQNLEPSSCYTYTPLTGCQWNKWAHHGELACAGGWRCHRPEHSSHMSHVSCSSRADACLRDIVYSVNYLCKQTEERDIIFAEWLSVVYSSCQNF